MNNNTNPKRQSRRMRMNSFPVTSMNSLPVSSINGMVAAGSHAPRRSQNSVRNYNRVKRYEKILQGIHANFREKLVQRAPGITPMELRLCILARAFVEIDECASILAISTEGID